MYTATVINKILNQYKALDVTVRFDNGVQVIDATYAPYVTAKAQLKSLYKPEYSGL